MANEISATGDQLTLYAPITSAPFANGQSTTTAYRHHDLGGTDCTPAGPFGTYRWSRSGNTLTLTAVHDAGVVVWRARHGPRHRRSGIARLSADAVAALAEAFEMDAWSSIVAPAATRSLSPRCWQWEQRGSVDRSRCNARPSGALLALRLERCCRR